MSLCSFRLLVLPVLLWANSVFAQDMCGLAGGTAAVRIAADGDPLRISLRSGDLVYARAISLARGTARLESDVLGTVEVDCAMVVSASRLTVPVRGSEDAPRLPGPFLVAAEADAVRGRSADTQVPVRSGSPPTPVIRPELEEALRRAELLRNPGNLQVGLGRIRLTTGFNLALGSGAGNSSRDLGVSQQVSYGVTDALSVFASVSYTQGVQDTLTLPHANAGATPNRVRSVGSSLAAGASYRLNLPTAAVPAFTVTGLIGAPARSVSGSGESIGGDGHHSATIRIEAGREYDSVSWAAAIFATALGAQTISDLKVQPGFRSGVDLFGALMLNDRYSVYASLKIADSRHTRSAGIALPGTARQRLSTEYGFVSELTPGRLLSVRIGNLLGGETNTATVEAALTLEF